jgi:sulfur-oxidizing protein SoxA
LLLRGHIGKGQQRGGRRLRNCLVGVRAEAYPYGAPEYVDLELYLMSRAAGMPVETPAVRP